MPIDQPVAGTADILSGGFAEGKPSSLNVRYAIDETSPERGSGLRPDGGQDARVPGCLVVGVLSC